MIQLNVFLLVNNYLWVLILCIEKYMEKLMNMVTSLIALMATMRTYSLYQPENMSYLDYAS